MSIEENERDRNKERIENGTLVCNNGYVAFVREVKLYPNDLCMK